jgi:zinc/manganese transport system substrate-binding protein/manganese/iron transport system substrate-binding protein
MSFSIVSLMLRFLAPLLLVLGAVLGGCGSDDDGAASGGSVHVVATTTQVADLARNVVGDRAQVTQLLDANADPHGYELRPRDVDALVDADVVLRSGGDVDEWLDEAVDSSGTSAEVVTLIDSVKTIEGGHGHDEEAHGEEEDHGEEAQVDPHWWQDPRNAVLAVDAIERAMATADPANTKAYAEQGERYRARIEALDGAVAKCWDEVPEAERKLVTTHDALGYYAQRYGLEVIGAVIPSLSTQAQPSAGELAELAETIRREQVKAVFAESSVNSKVERVIADEAGAAVGKALWADSLGPEGSDGATYLQSIASNTRALVDGLTAGAVSCAPPAD